MLNFLTGSMILPITIFEPRIGSNCSANWATTTTPLYNCLTMYLPRHASSQSSYRLRKKKTSFLLFFGLCFSQLKLITPDRSFSWTNWHDRMCKQTSHIFLSFSLSLFLSFFHSFFLSLSFLNTISANATKHSIWELIVNSQSRTPYLVESCKSHD